MAKTYANLISEVRAFVQDSEEPFRNEDSFFINILNRGLQEIGRLRPDAFYELFDGNSLHVPEVIVGTTDATYDEYSTTENFQLEMQFYNPLFSFIVGMAEVQDDEFTDEGRASMLLIQFRNTVVGL